MSNPKFILLLSLFAAHYSAQACNRRLMESYDITGQDSVVKDSNSMCAGLKNNCCSAQAQLDIYKRWNMGGAAHRIAGIYRTAETTITALFKVFTRVEQLAVKSIPYSSDIQYSNCKKMATRIHELSMSSLAPKVQGKLLDATGFLRNARKGFYCALCDPEAHPFFNTTDTKFYTSGAFCAKLSTSILTYYTFRFKFFPQIARLYSQWTVRCDINGNFNPKSEIKAAYKFYRQSTILGNLVSCQQGYKKPGAVLACKKLCKRFNPVKFDRYFEGELDKINGLADFLTRKLNRMERKFGRDLVKQESLQSTVAAARKLADKRQLTEDKEPPKPASDLPPVEHLNEAISEVSYFNRKFKTGLVPPILYDFKNDFQIKFNKGLYESIFPLGTDIIVNLQNYRNVVAPKGIDFDKYGSIAKFEYESAQTAFNLLNQGKPPTTVSLDQFLRTMK